MKSFSADDIECELLTNHYLEKWATNSIDVLSRYALGKFLSAGIPIYIYDQVVISLVQYNTYIKVYVLLSIFNHIVIEQIITDNAK